MNQAKTTEIMLKLSGFTHLSDALRDAAHALRDTRNNRDEDCKRIRELADFLEDLTSVNPDCVSCKKEGDSLWSGHCLQCRSWMHLSLCDECYRSTPFICPKCKEKNDNEHETWIKSLERNQQ